MTRIAFRVALATFVGLAGSITHAGENITCTSSPQMRPLSLIDALNAIRIQSLDSQRARIAHDIATSDLAIVNRGTAPKVTVQGTLKGAYSDTSSAKAASGRGDNQPVYDQAYSLAISQTIIDFGRTRSNRRAAEADVDAKELGEQEVWQKVGWNTVRLYQSAVSASQVTQVLGSQLELASARLKEQRSNFNNGLRPESDVVSAEVDVGKARLSLQKACDDESLSHIQLAQWLMDSKQPITIIRGVHYRFPMADMRVRSPKEWQSKIQTWQVVRQTPAERRRIKELESLEAERSGLRATAWPELKAAVTAEEAGQWQPMHPQYSAQLQLAWDVPWSGLLSSQMQRLSLREADLQVVQQEERKILNEQANLAKETISALSRQWDTVEGQVTLVARQQVLVRNRYNGGKASAIELSMSDMDMVSIRVDRLKVSNQFTVAAFDLAESLGVPVEGGMYP